MASEMAVVGERGMVDSGQWDRDREKLDLLKRTICVGSTDDEFALFVHVAKRMGLDPFARQIHAVKRYSTEAGKEVMSIQVGIDGYRAIAQKTGEYAGSDDYTFDEGLNQSQMIQANRKRPVTATATIWRIVKGVRCPFTATAGFEEYKAVKKDGTLNRFWQTRPFLMLGKCAEALAMRKGFPAELAGTYTNDEMEQAGEESAHPVKNVPLPPRRSEKAKQASPPAPPAIDAPQGNVERANGDLDQAAVGEPSTLHDMTTVIEGNNPLDDAIIRASVGDVMLKSGGQGDKKWTLYGVGYTPLDGRHEPGIANTFDKDWGKLAEKAKEEGLVARLTIAPSKKYPGKFDLTSFEVEEG